MMIHTIQNSYTKLRKLDITEADVTMDGGVAGSKLTEVTDRDYVEFGTDVNGIALVFSGEAVDGDTFDAFVWGVTNEGWAEAIAEISGTVGTAIADVTNADNTSRLFVDTINIKDEFHLKDVTVADSGNNRYAKLGWDTLGLKGMYICVTAVGGAGEVDRLTPWVRTF
jgi:hypothetical protein